MVSKNLRRSATGTANERRTSSSNSADVAADIVDNVENVSEVYSTSGQHDLLAKFNLPRDADIGTFVTKQVQTRPHIRDTFTVITFSPFLPSKK